MDRFRNLKLWIYGLTSTAISAAAGSVAVVIVDPKDFNLQEGLPKLLTVAAVMAIIALANYLQKHPLPEWQGEERRSERGTPAGV